MNKKTILKVFIASVLSVTFAVSAAAEHKGENTDKGPRASMKPAASDMQTIVRNATSVYKALVSKGVHGAVPPSVLTHTECIAVIPNIITAAAIIGGSHGDGVVSCKLIDGKWSELAFFDLKAGSLGVQVGAKSTDIVIYFTSGEAISALKRGKFEFVADASVVAGSFDSAFDIANAGVVVYQQSSGAFIGASITGGTLSASHKANRNYYGKDVDATALLEGHLKDIKAKENTLTPLFPQTS